jgi:hypothetical protein
VGSVQHDVAQQFGIISGSLADAELERNPLHFLRGADTVNKKRGFDARNTRKDFNGYKQKAQSIPRNNNLNRKCFGNRGTRW